MRIAMLISGGGTTMASIVKACQDGRLKNIEPVLVIASRPNAAGLERALGLGLPKANVIVLKPKDFLSGDDFGQAIINACGQRGVQFIGQYGWLCKTPANVIKKFNGMMVNQHPGPLDIGRPDFGGQGMYGRRVHAARLLFVQKVERDFWTEATAQRVAIDYDYGAVLKAIKVPILKNDTVDSLQARVLPFEHEAQIQTLRDFADNKVKEIKRETPLILPGEESILEECKQEAIRLYPQG